MILKDMSENNGIEALNDDELDQVNGGAVVKVALVQSHEINSGSVTWLCKCGHNNFGGNECEYCGLDRSISEVK